MTLGDLIKSYREANDMSTNEFARRSGISKAYVSQLERNFNSRTGRAPVPSMEYIEKAAKAMFLSFDEIFALLNGETTADFSSKKAIRIPVLGDVAAGIPIEAVENILDYEEISESLAATGEFFGLKIKGDSMAPEIKDGDIVIVRQQETAESGDIVIALVNGDSATCKRLVKYEQGIRLLPLNPSYEPFFYTKEEVASKPVRVIGKVVENRRKY